MTYSVKDLANRYNVNEHTVLNWITGTGELKAMNVGVAPGKKKSRYRVTEESLRAFEALRSTSPPRAPLSRRRKKREEANWYSRPGMPPR